MSGLDMDKIEEFQF